MEEMRFQFWNFEWTVLTLQGRGGQIGHMPKFGDFPPIWCIFTTITFIGGLRHASIQSTQAATCISQQI